MKSVIAALAAAGAGLLVLCSGGSAHAWPWPTANLPWCVTTDGGDYLDCSYFTQRQCVETARGVGNCQHNSDYEWGYRWPGTITVVPTPRRHHHHRRHPKH